MYNINSNRIYIDGCDETKKIESFKRINDNFIEIIFKNGKKPYKYRDSRIKIEQNTEADYKAKNIMEYFLEEASIYNFKNEEENCNSTLLTKYFSKITNIKNSILDFYLYKKEIDKINFDNSLLIFPFGINTNQKLAVENAFSNTISVIQGPPGTGKTQTILNIIANAILYDKSIAVVSNNNSAILNIDEKLKKYNLDFLSATLGCKNNREIFVSLQNEKNINLSTFYPKIDDNILLEEISNKVKTVEKLLKYQNKLPKIIERYNEYNLEYKHFMANERKIFSNDKNSLKKVCNSLKEKTKINNVFKNQPSNKLFKLLVHCLNKKNIKNGIFDYCYFFMMLGFNFFFICQKQFYSLIFYIQKNFYLSKMKEIKKEIKKYKTLLADNKLNIKMASIKNKSLTLLKNKIYEKYYGNPRREFDFAETENIDENFVFQYPIIFSTLFSLKNICGNNFIFDYLIVDEASQADILTGALSMSCAKNMIIVGDSMQLPNIIEKTTKKLSEEILNKYNVDDPYIFHKHSLLSSIMSLYPKAPTILLKEHYRCHPKIINFCNKKFYRNELLIMTKDNREDNVLKAIKTRKGNYEKEYTNQRQIDIIKKEILPLIQANESIAIITPYRNQVRELKNNFKENKNIEIDTIHKFQGREKDVIIFSTVNNNICNFIDDPNLLNVAISRAIKSFYIVYSNEKGKNDSNIMDLVNYIKYNNFESTTSKVYSIFDLLYRQYKTERLKFLSKHKRVSQYASENIAYYYIEKISKEKERCLDIAIHVPLKNTIKINKNYSIEEIEFINKDSHLDFLIYNKITRNPILAIEIDGYNYHKNNTIQEYRDNLKNNILKKANLMLLRLNTNGSDEETKISDAIDMALKIN